MSKVIAFDAVCRLVGKEYVPAREKPITIQGQTFDAHEEYFQLYFLVGKRYPNSPLYAVEPQVAMAKTVKADFVKLKTEGQYMCSCEQSGKRISVISAEGLQILQKENAELDFEIFDEPESAPEKAKKA